MKIVVNYYDQNDKLKKVGFDGTWLVEEFKPKVRHRDFSFSVALTKKKQLFVLRKDKDERGKYSVYPSFEEFKQNVNYPELVEMVAHKTGEEDYEYLDI